MIFGAGVYGITNQEIADKRGMTLEEQVWQMAIGGVCAVQLRDKEADNDEIFMLALKLRIITERFGIPLIINDRVEVALRLNLPVHLGQDDIKWTDLSALVKAKIRFGISTHSLEQAFLAEKKGASYIGIGPVYQTSTKPNYRRIGFSLAEKVVKSMNIPVVVIGGLSRADLHDFFCRGFRNVAMVRDLLEAKNISNYVEEVNGCLKQFSPGRTVF